MRMDHSKLSFETFSWAISGDVKDKKLGVSLGNIPEVLRYISGLSFGRQMLTQVDLLLLRLDLFLCRKITPVKRGKSWTLLKQL